MKKDLLYAGSGREDSTVNIISGDDTNQIYNIQIIRNLTVTETPEDTSFMEEYESITQCYQSACSCEENLIIDVIEEKEEYEWKPYKLYSSPQIEIDGHITTTGAYYTSGGILPDGTP